MRRSLFLTVSLGVLGSASATVASSYTGKLALGYVWIDETGNQSVNQPTFNLYEGMALSLRQFRWNASNGMYVFGDLKNITLNNRNARAGISRPGQYYLALHTRQYRRIYSADGSQNTQRSVNGGNVWFQPHRNIRLYGNYDLTYKRGSMVELYDLDVPSIDPVDFKYSHYRAGVRLSKKQSSLELDFRGASYDDQNDSATTDFTTTRYRLSGRTPIPKLERLWVNAGFEHYERKRDEGASLKTNVGWGGLRYNFPRGWAARYSLIWDQSQATTDQAVVDNVVNSFSAEKTWARRGGISAGYRYRYRDDVWNRITGNGFFGAGWLRPTPAWNLRADFGTTSMDGQKSNLLTGNYDNTRVRVSAAYYAAFGKLRVKYENRNRKQEDIGSQIDFNRLGADLTLKNKRYGRLVASYTYIQGDYTNAESAFLFTDHLFDGQIETANWKGIEVLFGGSYLRSQKNLDNRRYSVRAGGRYTFKSRYGVEIIYTSYSFDDFNDANTSVLYTQFYTANIVQVNLITNLGSP